MLVICMLISNKLIARIGPYIHTDINVLGISVCFGVFLRCTVHSCVCLYHTPERDSVPGSSEDDVTASLRSAPERDAVISRECQDQDQ